MLLFEGRSGEAAVDSDMRENVVDGGRTLPTTEVIA